MALSSVIPLDGTRPYNAHFCIDLQGYRQLLTASNAVASLRTMLYVLLLLRLPVLPLLLPLLLLLLCLRH